MKLEMEETDIPHHRQHPSARGRWREDPCTDSDFGTCTAVNLLQRKVDGWPPRSSAVHPLGEGAIACLGRGAGLLLVAE